MFAVLERMRGPREKSPEDGAPNAALLDAFTTQPYEFGWSYGPIDGEKDWLTWVDVTEANDADGRLLVRYNYANGLLEGSMSGHSLQGTWIQSEGSGTFALQFSEELQEASGWWDRGAGIDRHPADRHPAYMRRAANPSAGATP